MELRDYLEALRKSWLLIVGLALVGAVLAFAAFSLATPQYADTVTFYVSTPVSQNQNAQSAGQFAQNRVTSYVELLQSDRLAEDVAKEAGLPTDAVTGSISATAQASTVLVTATVTDASADRAAQIAKGLAVAFPSLVDVLDNAGRQADVVKVNVTSGPTASAGPIAPQLSLYGAAGIGGGLVLGVLIAIVRALLDQSVRTGESAAALVGAPLIGSIVADGASRRTPLAIGDAGTSIRAEEYRRLRTSLRFIDAAERADVVLVTSSTPQEGKSITAVNLAISLAEDGQNVLLIDGDLRRPSAAKLLGLEQQVGVTNVLIDQVDLDRAIQQWRTTRLDFLSSGQIPPNPSELLGGARMASLIEELRGRYDKIIIDSPPALAVADAAVIAHLVDGIVFVVRSGKTQRASIRAAARSLDGVGGRVIGTVLNMRKETRGRARDYSYTRRSGEPGFSAVKSAQAVGAEPISSNEPVSSKDPVSSKEPVSSEWVRHDSTDDGVD